MNISTTILIVVTSAIVLGIGALISFVVGRRHNSNEDWVVGGRDLPLYVVAFTQYATAVGGGVLVAHVGISYAWGFSVFWYELFVVVGLLILAMFAGWLRKRKFSTIPEIFTRLYGSNKLLISLVALAVIVVPMGWLATQFVAFGNLFSAVTGLNFNMLVVLMALISLLFVLPGGLTSVAWSDFFFGVFMVVASVIVAIYAINSAGGVGEMVSNLPDELVSLPEGFMAAGGTTILLWLFAIVPGTLTNQLYYQRIFAAKSGSEARRGIYISAVMVFISGAYALIIGLSVRSQVADFGVDGREQAAGWLLDQMPSWLLALYGAFLMATIVSTTGSALQSIVVNLVEDLRKTFVKDVGSDNRKVMLSRVATVAVTILAAVLSIVYPQALNWLVATYAYSASMLVVPLLLGIILNRRFEVPRAVAFMSMGGGVVACAIAHIAGTVIPYAIFGVALSLVVYVVALLIFKPKTRSGNSVAEGASA